MTPTTVRGGQPSRPDGPLLVTLDLLGRSCLFVFVKAYGDATAAQTWQAVSLSLTKGVPPSPERGRQTLSHRPS